jgi:alkanesulfonate monooxygenase SsuD/methylene tetrahydromethanopterin reductase-like flavin-dependent oxidoreductase (luciferase family)
MPTLPVTAIGRDPRSQPGPVDAEVDVARAASSAGFDVVWLVGPDDRPKGHPGGSPRPTARGIELDAADPVTLAGGLAARVPDVAIGVIVDVAGGRHPLVLARDMLSLDVVTGGRTALLLRDSEAVGATDGSRGSGSLDRVAEAAAICREMLSGSVVSKGGRFFRKGSVRPALRPLDGTGPPVLVQLGGELGPAPDDGLVACVRSADMLVTGGSADSLRATRAAVVAASAAAGSPVPLLLWRGSFDPLTGRPTLEHGARGGTPAQPGGAHGLDGLVVRSAGHQLPTGQQVAALGRWWHDPLAPRLATDGD